MSYNHLKYWDDKQTINRMEGSEKSQDVHQAEIENHLKSMALRFERSPNQATIQMWAKDLSAMGYKHQLIGQICRNIPFKMDKHPTLNEIMALVKPHLPQESFLVDELTDLSHRCYDHLKAKFMKAGNQEVLTLMTKSYAIHVFPSCEHFTEKQREMLVLNDWLRCYFKTNPQAIIDQGRISNEAFERNDKEYFINPLRKYAKENGL
jgi:hypothetical protein